VHGLGALVRLAPGALLVLVVAAGCSFTRGFVYHPEHDDGHSEAPAALSADEPAVEDLVFFSFDGTKLHGWLARYKGATRAILACHGNAGNVEGRGRELCLLRRVARAHVLMFDYRGYGRSEGEPTEAGVSADAEAALLALARETDVPLKRTIVLGHSLGGAVAIEVARKKPAVGGLVVLASFTSMDDMVRALTLPGLGLLVPESWASIDKVAAIACPKLFVHGELDPIVPFEQGRRLQDAAAEPKRFVPLPDGGHMVLQGSTGPRVLTEIGRFVDGVAPETSQGSGR
jgi:fermentation-respiration switch protein FrsA (DUF1100 family)